MQPNLSDMKFDAKLDDVQFVGYPVTVHHSQERLDRKNKQDMTSTTIVNVVFALPVNTYTLLLNFCCCIMNCLQYLVPTELLYHESKSRDSSMTTALGSKDTGIQVLVMLSTLFETEFLT